MLKDSKNKNLNKLLNEKIGVSMLSESLCVIVEHNYLGRIYKFKNYNNPGSVFDLNQ